MTTLKRCFCGKFRKHDGWTKPDAVQLEAISLALAKKEAKIESLICDECSSAYRGFEERLDSYATFREMKATKDENDRYSPPASQINRRKRQQAKLHSRAKKPARGIPFDF